MTKRILIVPATVILLAAVLELLQRHINLPRPNLHWISLPPSRFHILGTTPDGREILAVIPVLVIRASAESLWSTTITLILGSGVGFAAAWSPNSPFDNLQFRISRLIDSIGPFLLMTCVAAVMPQISPLALASVAALVAWPTVSAIVRAEAVALSRAGFIEAARAIGMRPVQIAAIHLLPFMLERLGPLFFALYLGFIAFFAALDFIGVRTASQQSLGFAIFEASTLLRSAPWYFLATTIGFAFLVAISLGAMRLLGAIHQRLSRRLIESDRIM